jgi:hypothetical protein
MRGTFALLTLITIGCGGSGDPMPGGGMSGGGMTGGNGSTGGGNAGGGGSGGGGSGGGGSNPLGPIAIKNASARALAANNTSITFVLENAASARLDIERVDLIRLRWDTGMLNFAFGCERSPWVSHTEVTPVLTLGLSSSSGLGTQLVVDCNDGGSTHQLGAPVTTPAPGAMIQIEVGGIMTDATPFTAVASASVL